MALMPHAHWRLFLCLSNALLTSYRNARAVAECCCRSRHRRMPAAAARFAAASASSGTMDGNGRAACPAGRRSEKCPSMGMFDAGRDPGWLALQYLRKVPDGGWPQQRWSNAQGTSGVASSLCAVRNARQVPVATA